MRLAAHPLCRQDGEPEGARVVSHPVVAREEDSTAHRVFPGQSRCKVERIERADRLDGKGLGRTRADRIVEGKQIARSEEAAQPALPLALLPVVDSVFGYGPEQAASGLDIIAGELER